MHIFKNNGKTGTRETWSSSENERNKFKKFELINLACPLSLAVVYACCP